MTTHTRRARRRWGLLVAAACAAPVLGGCGGSGGEEAYPTLQACYDDHHVVEALGVTEALVVCCTDHEIAGVKPACGATQAACETYANAELTDATTAAEITTACAEYITQLGM